MTFDSNKEVEHLLQGIKPELPNEVFERRLREQFAAGFPSLEAGPEEVDGEQDTEQTAATTLRAVPAQSRSSSRRPQAQQEVAAPGVLKTWWIPVAAALAASLLFMFSLQESALEWTVTGADALAQSFKSKETIVISEGMDFRLPDGLEVHATKDTELTQVATTAGSDKSNGRPEITLRVDTGMILIRTPKDYLGPQLLVQTPQTEVRVVGTVLSVMTDPKLTCVCVARGSVEVNDEQATEGLATVGEGTTRVVFTDKQEESMQEPSHKLFDPKTPYGRKHSQPLKDYAASSKH